MDRWRCAEGCGDLVVISTKAGDGSEVTLRACGSCESRSWSRNGNVVALQTLLDAMTGPTMELQRVS